jgi:voltage-gated sodium channel
MTAQLRRIVHTHAFDVVILVVIVANAVVLGLQTYPGVAEEYGDTLDLLNGVFLGVFVVELLLRIASLREPSPGLLP